MTRETTDHDELTDLEPLPELPEADELPELPEAHELPELPPSPRGEEPRELPPRPGREPRGGELPEGEKRKLEKAPLHLRKAALIAAGFSLLPWIGAVVTSVPLLLAAKAVVLAGIYVYYAEVCVRRGEAKKVPGFFGPLQAIRNGQVLHAIALVIAVVGCSSLVDGADWRGWAEKGMLAWAAATWVHIYDYERGGRFNPLFPLMFLAHLTAGLFGFFGAVSAGDKDIPTLVAMAGSLGVAVGGGFAVYTIVEAMKQAKIEGEAKRQAALEARRAARRQRSRQ